jgi:hypothetical protein
MVWKLTIWSERDVLAIERDALGRGSDETAGLSVWLLCPTREHVRRGGGFKDMRIPRSDVL